MRRAGESTMLLKRLHGFISRCGFSTSHRRPRAGPTPRRLIARLALTETIERIRWECPTADALAAEGRSFDAESSDLGRERHARPGPCRGRTLGPPAVSTSGLTTPTFRTVSRDMAAAMAFFEQAKTVTGVTVRRAILAGER
jgi:hypothetical protein